MGVWWDHDQFREWQLDEVRKILQAREGEEFGDHHFPAAVEQLALAGVLRLTVAELRAPLPGTGIATDVALIFDGVSIRSTSFSIHESLLLTGFGCIDPGTGHIHERLVGAPSSGYRHDGVSTKELVLGTLGAEPLGFTLRDLRAIVVCVGGDGARGWSAPAILAPLLLDSLWRPASSFKL